jgi:16S rRNA (cytosine1402-N4)-methyltransferase
MVRNPVLHQPGEVAVDCTLGYGGHARELLAAVRPGGRLLGIDADPIELPKTDARLRSLGFGSDVLVVRRTNFAGLLQFVAAESPGGVDLLLADLGVSSMQIDDPARGFTFKEDGPLDMRMNPARGPTAADLLSKLNTAGLSRILTDNADEPHAGELARQILQAHAQLPLTDLTTDYLTAYACNCHQMADAGSTWFRALHCCERRVRGLGALAQNPSHCLKAGGRAILTFHLVRTGVSSLFGCGPASVYASIRRSHPCDCGRQRANPRSSAAKLRFAVRG